MNPCPSGPLLRKRSYLGFCEHVPPSARSCRFHLITPRESAWTLPPPSLPPPSPCVLVLCALWVSPRTNSGGSLDHQKIAKSFFKGTRSWTGVVGCLFFCWGLGLYTYRGFSLLVFWQFNHGDSQTSPCAAVRFPRWSANPEPTKQVCG